MLPGMKVYELPQTGLEPRPVRWRGCGRGGVLITRSAVHSLGPHFIHGHGYDGCLRHLPPEGPKQALNDRMLLVAEHRRIDRIPVLGLTVSAHWRRRKWLDVERIRRPPLLHRKLAVFSEDASRSPSFATISCRLSSISSTDCIFATTQSTVARRDRQSGSPRPLMATAQ